MQPIEPAAFYQTTRAARKVIVVDLGFLGDTIHLIPALWEIKDHYPQAELHVLTTLVGAGALKLARCVDRAWIFPLGPPSPRWWEHWGLLRALRRERFDVSYNFGGADRSVLVTRIMRPRHSIAYQGARRHFWQPWFVRNWIARASLPTPVYESRRDVLARCGFKLNPARFDLQVPEAETAWARTAVPAGSVHLSLGASSPLRELPMANHLELLRDLFQQDLDRHIVVTAAPNAREQSRLQHLRREITDARLLTIADRLTVPQLAAILQRCALHVGPDSGMIHLAAALNIPTLSIFRRNPDMANWMPRGPAHVCLDAPCVCIGTENPPCAATNEAACLAGISGETVAREIRKLVAAQKISK